MKLLAKFHGQTNWVGLAFPPVSYAHTMRFQHNIDLVKSSIVQILQTDFEERVLFPEFGSGLGSSQWEPLDEFFEQDVIFAVTQAIEMWEPRVELLNVELHSSDRDLDMGIARIRIEFQLISNPGSPELLDLELVR